MPRSKLNFLVVFESGCELAQVFSKSVVFKGEVVNVFSVLLNVVDNSFILKEEV